MIGQLTRLERLRMRDVERASRATSAAQVTLEQARIALASEEEALTEATTRLSRAIEQRAYAPGEEVARVYVTRSEEIVAHAETALRAARRALTDAEQALDDARREWMRAQVRRDAMTGLVDRQRREIARDRERRQADETNESLNSGGSQWA